MVLMHILVQFIALNLLLAIQVVALWRYLILKNMYLNIGTRQEGRALDKSVTNVNADSDEVIKVLSSILNKDVLLLKNEDIYGDGSAIEKTLKILKKFLIGSYKIMTDLKKLEIFEDTTIREAIKAIDRGNLQLAIVVDKKRRLLGTLTDGDIRRGILTWS